MNMFPTPDLDTLMSLYKTNESMIQNHILTVSKINRQNVNLIGGKQVNQLNYCEPCLAMTLFNQRGCLLLNIKIVQNLMPISKDKLALHVGRARFTVIILVARFSPILTN